MHLPNFNQSFENNQVEVETGRHSHQARGIGGGNNQQSRGIGGDTQQPRGGNNQRGLRTRWFDDHAKLHDSESGADFPIWVSRSSRLMMFLRAKKWHILVLMLFVYAVTMTTFAFVWREDDASTQVSNDNSNVEGTAPTLAPVDSEYTEIPTTGTVQPAAGDRQPSSQPGEVDDSPAASPSYPFASPLSVGLAGSSPSESSVESEVAKETIIQLGKVIGEEANATAFSFTLSGDGSTTAVALRKNPDVVRVRVYRYNSTGAWNQIGRDVVGAGELDGVGKSLALSEDGNTLAIGFFEEACSLGENCGHIRVYTFDESGWIQLGKDIVGANAFEFFGWSMAISNDGLTVAAGSALSHGENNKSHTGKVRVYRFESGAFRQLGGDLVGDGEWDHLGSSLSLSADGTIVASGAVQGLKRDLGYVKIYKYNNNTGSFSQLGTKIIGDNRTDNFGDAVSLSKSGFILAVGGTKGGGGEVDTKPSFGLVSIFRYTESGWSKVGTDVKSGATGDLFGSSVAINDTGDRIVVGAPECDSLAGCAMVYNFDETEAWMQLGETIRSASNDVSLPNQLGRSVAISSSGEVFAAGGRAGAQVYQVTPEISDNSGVEVEQNQTEANFAPASPLAPFASPASSPAGNSQGDTAEPSASAFPSDQMETTVPSAPYSPFSPTSPFAPSAPASLIAPSAPAGATSGAQTVQETPMHVVEATGETAAPQAAKDSSVPVT